MIRLRRFWAKTDADVFCFCNLSPLLCQTLLNHFVLFLLSLSALHHNVFTKFSQTNL